MEKGKLLDIADKTEDRSQRAEHGTQIKKNSLKSLFLTLLPVVCCLLSVFLASCSLPRIIILDDPLTPEEHINLGVAYERQGKFDHAIEEFKKASKRLPAAYLYLGNIYMQKEDFDEAEKYYKKAIKKQPNLADAYNNLAWLYYTKKENLQEAERLALKALELSPLNENYKDTLNNIRKLRNTK